MALFGNRREQGTAAQASFASALRRQTVRNGILLVVVLVVLAVPPVFVNHPVGYVPLLTYAFLLALCWVYLQIVRRGFSVEHGFEENSCVRGSSVELPLVLKNRSRLPILRVQPQVYVANPYGEREHETFAMAMIDAMDEDVMLTKVHLGHVGVYSAGVQGVVLYDPFMFFHAFCEVDGHASMAATPQVFDIASAEFSNLAMHDSLAPVRTVLSDDVDYAGTRDYEYGDPLKSIHWKLSARTNELQTRLFEASVNSKLAVVMDFHGNSSYSTEDLMACNDVVVEMALAVMRLALGRNLETHLRYVDKNGMAVSRDVPAEGEMEAFVANLPRLSGRVNQSDAVDVLEREMASNSGSDNIVLCTSALTKALVARALGSISRRIYLSVVLAVPRSSLQGFYKENQGLVGELESAGVPCIILSDASDIEGFGRID